MAYPSPVVIAVLVPGDAGSNPASLCWAARRVADAAGARFEAVILSAREDQRHANLASSSGAKSVRVLIHQGLLVPSHTDQLLAALHLPLADMMRAGEVPLFVLHADVVSEELASRLAARLKGHALGRCNAFEWGPYGWLARKPLLGGRIDVALRAGLDPCFAALRVENEPGAHGSIGAQPCGRETSAVSMVHLDTVLPKPRVRYDTPGSRRKPLENARIVVAGGRGMGSAEGFAMLERVAETLDAPMGGSLPAVDSGWVPVSHQIGQSGKFVMPEVYVAVGISGTVQHMAGIATHTDIVAINIDPGADIFKVATIGVVADWKSFLPVLIDKLEQGAGGAQ